MKNVSNLSKLLINIDINWWLKNDQFNRTLVRSWFSGRFKIVIHKVIHRKCGKTEFLHVREELAALCVESTLSVAFNSAALAPH